MLKLIRSSSASSRRLQDRRAQGVRRMVEREFEFSQSQHGESFRIIQGALPRGASAGEAGRQQIAAGGRFPVEHLARAEHAGQFAQHQVFVERLEAHAAGAADRLVERARGDKRERQRFYRVGELHRIVQLIGRQKFAQQRHFRALDAGAALQVAGQRTRAARMGDFGNDPRRGSCRAPGRVAPSPPPVPQSCRAAAPTAHTPGCPRCRCRTASARHGVHAAVRPHR